MVSGKRYVVCGKSFLCAILSHFFRWSAIVNLQIINYISIMKANKTFKNASQKASASMSGRRSKAYWSSLPVSRKAYEGFVARINDVMGTSRKAQMMIDAMDRYLAGDSDCTSKLDSGCRMAFEFLRQDIDVAMLRSKRARERALARAGRNGGISAGVIDEKSDNADADDAQPDVHISRSERRAMERAKRRKRRLRRLCPLPKSPRSR